MKLIFVVAILIACTDATVAQHVYPLQTVREDFWEASVVVRMNVTDTKVIGSDAYAYQFMASGQVTTSFKGKFKAGQQLEFHVRAEHGYAHTSMRGDQIAFLTSFVNRRNGPFQVLPSGNSVAPYTPELLLKVQRVWRESRRRRNRKYDDALGDR